MKKLILTFVLISSMLFAQAPVAKPTHSHRRLWIEVALVAAAVGVTILAEHEMRGQQHHHPTPAPTPAPAPALAQVIVIAPTPALPSTSLTSIQTLCSMGFCSGAK